MADLVDEDFLEEGFMFDGSSIAGWKGIEASDMKLMPDTESAYLDPFYAEKTLCVHCTVVEPDTERALRPRPARHRREGRGLPASSTGIGDTAYLRPRGRVLPVRQRPLLEHDAEGQL